MFGIETVIDDIARTLGRDALDVRRQNFYGVGERNVTPYGMPVDDNIIDELVTELETSSDYRQRRHEIAGFNRDHPTLRRGLALTPVKFGISFAQTFLNQAGALIHVYPDGTVLLHHGGTEMGQGLHTKIMQVVADELGVPIQKIRCAPTSTDAVPNTSATAASTGSDLNGAAAAAAAEKIRNRLAEFAAKQFSVAPSDVEFRDGEVHAGKFIIDFAEFVQKAYRARIQLSATGFYATPKIGYDEQTLEGRPFFYFAYGAAVSEVIIDTQTGENRILRVDILHDTGNSLNPAIDVGQIEGGFMQGVGWLTTEEVAWDENGRLLSDAAATYKIPAASDWPRQVNIRLKNDRPNPEATIYRSKGVGEPPLMLALSVFFAIKDAVASCAPDRTVVQLDAPATPEAILRAVVRATAERA